MDNQNIETLMQPLLERIAQLERDKAILIYNLNAQQKQKEEELVKEEPLTVEDK